MTSQTTNTKKKLNAMDWFIIIALLLCIAGAALRAFIGTDNALNGTVTMETVYGATCAINGYLVVVHTQAVTLCIAIGE